MNGFGDFTSLDLSSVDALEQKRILEAGNHDVEVVEAFMDDGQLVVEFKALDDNAFIRTWLRIFSDSEKQKNFSRQSLKSILECGGHPNPDHPGDVSSIKGLKLNIRVAMSKARINPTTGKRIEPKLEVKGYAPLSPDAELSDGASSFLFGTN